MQKDNQLFSRTFLQKISFILQLLPQKCLRRFALKTDLFYLCLKIVLFLTS